jgi:hypothetical protein
MSANAVSPGFELNDAGQLAAADNVGTVLSLTYRETVPGQWLRDYAVELVTTRAWGFDGLTKPGELPSIFADARFSNFWSVSGHYHYAPRAHSTTLTRGGPAMRTPDDEHLSLDLRGDPGKPVTWAIGVNRHADEIGWRELDVTADLSYRPAGRWQLSASPSVTRSRDQRQYVTQADSGPAATQGSRYILGRLDRREVAVRLRASHSLTQDLSVEFYAQPFVSIGRYHDLAEVTNPGHLGLRTYGSDGTRIERQPGGYAVTDGSTEFFVANPDFTVRSLRGSTVLRWEWRRGSTLYVVWQQDRAARESVARERLRTTLADLLRTPGEYQLAVKVSYWLPL